ncbi:MAG: biotin--[acetyl-CoA-carboxylase] ligase [Dehalococcoidia bacterium]|nr:biotin--[acetyl-CoA-carboxylase] ligase [Dehalococcoidia bacterium]
MSGLDSERLAAVLANNALGRYTIYLESTASTQDVAKNSADEGAPEGTIVIANEQTAGRGRQGRSWHSPPGANLYFTIILRPTIEQLVALPMAVPLAVAEGIEAATGINAGIKWPNDVLVGRRKIAGVLLDSEFREDQPRYALAGVGINVNFDTSAHAELRDIATSLQVERGTPVDTGAVLSAVMEAIRERYEQSRMGGAGTYQAWRQRLSNLGNEVTVHLPDGSTATGVAEDVTEQGALVLRLPGGETCVMPAGELRSGG